MEEAKDYTAAPRKRRRRKTKSPLGVVVAEAEAAGMSYGKYVAGQDEHLYRSARCANTMPSSWVHPQRTLLEGLNKELRHPETRAEYLNDPEAKRDVLIAEAEARQRAEILRRIHDAEYRVREFCRMTDECIRRKG